MGLLAKEANAIEHLPGARRGRLQLGLQTLIVLFELCAAIHEIQICRAAFHSFHLLQTSFGDECSPPKARQLVGQMPNEHFQFFYRS